MFDVGTQHIPVPNSHNAAIQAELDQILSVNSLFANLRHVYAAQKAYWDMDFVDQTSYFGSPEAAAFMDFLYSVCFYLYEVHPTLPAVEAVIVKELRWYTHVITLFDHVDSAIDGPRLQRQMGARLELLLRVRGGVDQPAIQQLLAFMERTYDLAWYEKFEIIALLRALQPAVAAASVKRYEKLVKKVVRDYLDTLHSSTKYDIHRNAWKAISNQKSLRKTDLGHALFASPAYDAAKEALELQRKDFLAEQKGFDIAKSVGAVVGLGFLIAVIVLLVKAQKKFQGE